MKNIYVLGLVLGFMIFSCNSKQDIQPEKLNGYWEISKVIKEDGEKIDFGYNSAIEFFEIKNNKGIRKKIYPKLEGKYQADVLADSIFITQKNEIFYLEINKNYHKIIKTNTFDN